jgi:hypothetical protein
MWFPRRLLAIGCGTDAEALTHKRPGTATYENLRKLTAMGDNIATLMRTHFHHGASLLDFERIIVCRLILFMRRGEIVSTGFCAS